MNLQVKKPKIQHKGKGGDWILEINISTIFWGGARAPEATFGRQAWNSTIVGEEHQQWR
jgi:hypothetical protein